MNQVQNKPPERKLEKEVMVYVVDDEPMVGELVETILSLHGLRSKVFRDPGQALDALCQADEAPNLLLTDFRMPGMNGMELIQFGKERFPAMKTMLFSGNVDESIQNQYAIKADAFLHKPFYPQALVNMVRSLVAS